MAASSNPISELYVVSRGQIEHNNLAIGQRLIWLNNCLAFMFGVYAALTLYNTSATPYWHTKAQMLSVVIPYIGVTVSLFTLADIVMALIRMTNVRKNYEKADPKEMAGIPMLDSSFLYRLFQRLSPVAQALVFLIVWGYLLVYDK